MIAEPRTYGALFYMLLSLATGIFYFTWVVTGISMSAGLGVLIIGIPFVILFFGSVQACCRWSRAASSKSMLGERMPRRPLYGSRGQPLLERIKELFIDPRTWATQLYFLLMLPLGIVYFTVVVVGLSVSASLIAVPVALLLGIDAQFLADDLIIVGTVEPWTWPLAVLSGVLLLFATMHVARVVGHLHAMLAKHMLVKSAQYA